MSVFYPSRFAGISWFRVFLLIILVSGVVLVLSALLFPSYQGPTVEKSLRYLVFEMKQDGTLSEEESALVSFISDSLLRTRKDYDILYDIQHIEFILQRGPVLKLSATREQRRHLKEFFSRLFESRHAEASFIAYLVCYDWLQAEKHGICSHEETEEVFRSYFDSFDPVNPSALLSTGLEWLRKLKARAETKQDDFTEILLWPVAIPAPQAQAGSCVAPC